MQQMEESFQTSVNSVRGQVKEDYALELRTAKMNMEERVEQQKQYIEEQEKQLQEMKGKLKSFRR